MKKILRQLRYNANVKLKYYKFRKGDIKIY